VAKRLKPSGNYTAHQP